MYQMKRFYPYHRWWLLIASSSALCLGCGLRFTPPAPDNNPHLSEVAQLSRDAARNYFRSVAENYATLSQEKFATVTAAMQRNVELDAQAREQYGKSLKAIMQGRISGVNPADALSEQAAETFKQMSLGFAEVAGKEVAP